MSVAVVSCVYGPMFGRFFPRWWEAVERLDPAPDRVIIGTHSPWTFEGPDEVRLTCDWDHPQAFYLQKAIEAADTDWVWIHDIDDIAMPDALAGLEDVRGDVWQLGFLRSDGERYVPPQMSNDDYLNSWTNPYVGSSVIRRDAFLAAGGFSDVALQDWALWRRLAARGAIFVVSSRPHFHYMRHHYARGEIELVSKARAAHIRDLMEAEAAVA